MRPREISDDEIEAIQVPEQTADKEEYLKTLEEIKMQMRGLIKRFVDLVREHEKDDECHL